MKIHKRLIDLQSPAEIVKQIVRQPSHSRCSLNLTSGFADLYVDRARSRGRGHHCRLIGSADVQRSLSSATCRHDLVLAIQTLASHPTFGPASWSVGSSWVPRLLRCVCACLFVIRSFSSVACAKLCDTMRSYILKYAVRGLRVVHHSARRPLEERLRRPRLSSASVCKPSKRSAATRRSAGMHLLCRRPVHIFAPGIANVEAAPSDVPSCSSCRLHPGKCGERLARKPHLDLARRRLEGPAGVRLLAADAWAAVSRADAEDSETACSTVATPELGVAECVPTPARLEGRY